MNSRKSPLTHSPFQNLKVLLEAKAVSLPAEPKPEAGRPAGEQSPASEEKLFSEAMEGVTPISRDNCVERILQTRPAEPTSPEGCQEDEDAEILSRLTDLIQNGTGFRILDTPEYIEGTGYDVLPEIARSLHRGDYSIQAHVDLHGLIANEAQKVLEKFLRGAVITGKRGVLIIHGRGLSSSSGPVLKAKVIEWLTHGPWRKWVLAYASARSCDGGAGATYVLLRPRPVSKRVRKRPQTQ